MIKNVLHPSWCRWTWKAALNESDTCDPSQKEDTLLNFANSYIYPSVVGIRFLWCILREWESSMFDREPGTWHEIDQGLEVPCKSCADCVLCCGKLSRSLANVYFFLFLNNLCRVFVRLSWFVLSCTFVCLYNLFYILYTFFSFFILLVRLCLSILPLCLLIFFCVSRLNLLHVRPFVFVTPSVFFCVFPAPIAPACLFDVSRFLLLVVVC